MQNVDGILFHLDSPVSVPIGRPTEVSIWVVASSAVEAVCVAGSEYRPLQRRSRTDVAEVFPSYPHVAGFFGNITSRDLNNRTLTFHVHVVGRKIVEIAHTFPDVKAQSTTQRFAAMSALLAARIHLALARSPEARWNSRLSIVLREARAYPANRTGRESLNRILSEFASCFPEAQILQIGANDGQTGDPLASLFINSSWRAVFVEPVEHLCKALAARYAGRVGIVIERAAVSTMDGRAPFFRLRRQNGVTPTWHDQLGSLDRRVLMKHAALIPNIESLIVEEYVDAITVDTLLARNHINTIDLLVIDTEGHDYVILKQINLRKTRPRIVLFEHQHLSESDKMGAFAFLTESGYKLLSTAEGDTIAWRT